MILNRNNKIYVAGHAGMVGKAVFSRLDAGGYSRVVVRSRTELDLRSQADVSSFFDEERPDAVILAAAKIGSIVQCRESSAEYLIDNLALEMNVIRAAYESGVKQLLFIASSNAYPEDAEQPIREESLMTGRLEESREPYAFAKLAGVKMCEMYHKQYGVDYFSVFPCNLYGPNDRFDPENAHVVPALIRKVQEAKETDAPYVTVWGTGKPKKEFMYADDLAEACIFLMESDKRDKLWYNVGTGVETSVCELAECISDVVGYTGEIRFDESKPDGVMRHVMDCSRIHELGWNSRVDLTDGLRMTYRWFLDNRS